MAAPTFLLNVVVNDEQKIIGAFAGNWVTAHRAACDLVDRLYGVPAHEKTPLVIASAGGYPKDLNFYQTIKTLCNAQEVSQEGGTIILVTKSDEGFGNEDTRRLMSKPHGKQDGPPERSLRRSAVFSAKTARPAGR